MLKSIYFTLLPLNFLNIYITLNEIMLSLWYNNKMNKIRNEVGF